MTQITDEMKVAAVKAYTEVDGKCRPAAMQKALEAALPFLPIAGEGKVKALEWTQGDEDPRYHFAQSPIGNYSITDFPVVGDDQLTVRLLGTSQYGTWFRTLDEAKAAANDDYTKRVLACLISSPGKDGGQEVGSTHEERIALAAALTWDVNNITPDEVRGVIGRLAAEGFRLQRVGGQHE